MIYISIVMNVAIIYILYSVYEYTILFLKETYLSCFCLFTPPSKRHYKCLEHVYCHFMLCIFYHKKETNICCFKFNFLISLKCFLPLITIFQLFIHVPLNITGVCSMQVQQRCSKQASGVWLVTPIHRISCAVLYTQKLNNFDGAQFNDCFRKKK